MAADLGLVMQSAEAQPHEFAADGARDRLAERGLAHAGRADEAEDRALAFGVELAHGQEFENALLDLGQAVMVLVQDAARLGDVDALFGELRPRQLDQPIEVAADHGVLGARLGRALEPRQLLQRLLLGLLRHLGLFNGLAKLGDLGAGAFALAKLLLNLAKLLAQDVLALPALQRFLGLLADLLGQAQDFDLLRQDAQQLVQALLDVEGLEQVLLLGRREVGGIGDEIGKRRRRLNLVYGVGKLFRQRRQQRDRLARPLLQLMHAGGDLGRIDLGLANLIDQGDKEGVARHEFGDAEAAGAARDEVMAAVLRGHVAQDFGDRADAMEVLGPRRVDGRVVLEQHADGLVGARGSLRAGNGLRAAEPERRHDAGEQHGVAGRQDDQCAIGQLQIGSGCLLGRGGCGLCRIVHGIKPAQPSLTKVSTRQPFASSRSARRKRLSCKAMRRSKLP